MSESKITYFFSLPIFIPVFAVGVIFLNFSVNSTFFGFEENAIFATVYAQSDLSALLPEELEQQAKDYLSSLMELQNQSNTNESLLVNESVDSTSADETDFATQRLATDVSGHYSNPSYGILDFVIPSGWYGSERQWSGDESISLDMHQGTETEYMDRLLSPQSGDSTVENDPTMILESKNKTQLQYIQSGLGEKSPVAEEEPANQCKSLDGSFVFLNLILPSQ